MGTTGLVVVLLVVGVIWLPGERLGLTLGVERAGPTLALAALAYVGSHLVRILRMALILASSAPSMRGVAIAHAVSAPVAMLVPSRVGELARVYAFGRASSGVWNGVGAVWIERSFDAATLGLVGGVVVLVLPGTAPLVLPVVILAAVFLGLTAAAILVLPENVAATKDFLIRRYSAPWSLSALRAVDRFGKGLRASKDLIAGKVATLATLTVVLWSLEALALWSLTSFADLTVPDLLVGVLAVLSDSLQRLGVGTWDLQRYLPVYRMLVVLTTLAMCLVALVGERAMRSGGRGRTA